MVKDSLRTTTGELQKIVEYLVVFLFFVFLLSNSNYITTCCLGGFREKFS